jgi:hypothetical protein
MTIHLVVDNTDRFNYIDNLLRAIHVATSGEPLPQDMRDLLLNIDEATIESDLRLAVSQCPCEGSENATTALRVI